MGKDNKYEIMGTTGKDTCCSYDSRESDKCSISSQSSQQVTVYKDESNRILVPSIDDLFQMTVPPIVEEVHSELSSLKSRRTELAEKIYEVYNQRLKSVYDLVEEEFSEAFQVLKRIDAENIGWFCTGVDKSDRNSSARESDSDNYHDDKYIYSAIDSKKVYTFKGENKTFRFPRFYKIGLVYTGAAQRRLLEDIGRTFSIEFGRKTRNCSGKEYLDIDPMLEFVPKPDIQHLASDFCWKNICLNGGTIMGETETRKGKVEILSDIQGLEGKLNLYECKAKELEEVLDPAHSDTNSPILRFCIKNYTNGEENTLDKDGISFLKESRANGLSLAHYCLLMFWALNKKTSSRYTAVEGLLKAFTVLDKDYLLKEGINPQEISQNSSLLIESRTCETEE